MKGNLFAIVLGIILMLNLVSAIQYSDCGVYGNCKSVTSTSQGDTYINATFATLTNDSMADALHRHSELSASDGTPNANLFLDTVGKVTISGADTTTNVQVGNLAEASVYQMIGFNGVSVANAGIFSYLGQDLVLNAGTGKDIFFKSANTARMQMTSAGVLLVDHIGELTTSHNIVLNNAVTTTASITADHFHGRTDAEDVIIPSNMGGELGFAAAREYGAAWTSLLSDTDARIHASFYVRKGGTFKVRISGDVSDANVGKTMSGILYGSSGTAGTGGLSWNEYNAANWDIALPAGSGGYLEADFGTTFAVDDNSFVGLNYFKDDNAGGAVGSINAYQILLIRQ